MIHRIADVRVRILEAPIEDAIQMSFATLDCRRMALVEVESDRGLIGYGESWINYPPWAAHERIATIREGIAPALVGREIRGVRSLLETVERDLMPLGRQWGAPGPVHQALSGVEIAVWDLLGKIREVSVAELLGGCLRSEVPVYASGLFHTSARRLAENVRRDGFDAIKCRVGFGMDTDVATLATIREVIGDHVTVFVDANQAWSLREAIGAVRRLNEFDISWFEEPVSGGRLTDLRVLFERTGAVLAIGENVYGLRDFADLIRAPAVGVLQPDVSKVGGIGVMHTICTLAASHGVPVVPHWYGGAVSLAATLQLAASCSAIELVEYDVHDNPLRDEMLEAPLRAKDGILAVPEGPGLGITVKSAVTDAYEAMRS